MGTVTDKLNKLLGTKTAIKNAIITKGQSVTDSTKYADYPAKILAIQTGVDTSDATAAAGDILSGKTAYAKGSKITGTIAARTSADLSANGASVTVPAGHYASQCSKSVHTATQATPSITVSSAGLITASAAQPAGYVSAGTKSATHQLTTQAAQTITPGTANKTISSGRYLTGTQTIKGDSNLKAEYIRNGVTIFGVTGTYGDPVPVTLTLNIGGYDVNLTARENIDYIITVPNGSTLQKSAKNNDSVSLDVTLYGYGTYTVKAIGTTTQTKSVTFVNGGATTQSVDFELG